MYCIIFILWVEGINRNHNNPVFILIDFEVLSPLRAVDYLILDLNLHPFQIQFKSKYLLSIIWPLTNQSCIVNCDYSFVFEYKYEIWILWVLFFVCLQLSLKNQFLYI